MFQDSTKLPPPSNMKERRRNLFSDTSAINQERRLSYLKSPAFQEALAVGLDGLSKDLGEDGTSQYSREADRLFLASLSGEDRSFWVLAKGVFI